MTKIIVGYQGEPGAFSEQAVGELLPESNAQGFRTFDALISGLARREITYALLPVENSIYGTIARSYDLLWMHPQLHIIDETSLHIIQSLIGTPDAVIEDIEEVRSHPVALEQCHLFLGAHPTWQRTIVDDTAGAVREIAAQGNPRVAAIASSYAARVYGARVIAEGVQDDPHNYTRFFLISHESVARRSRGNACIALAFPSRVGSLRDALTVLADAGLNLRSLLSRPSGEGPFQYRFYCEIENGERDYIEKTLERITGNHRILGCY